MQTLSRPNFFPGQVLDYRDFNRLASYPDRVNSLICRHLFEGGGVVLEALDQFEIKALKGLSVLVKPGMALLPNGQAAVLDKEIVVDLAPFATKSAKTLIVSVTNTTHGEDRFEDASDPSISGYRSESQKAEIKMSQRTPAPNSIELFRVAIARGLDKVEVLDSEKEWSLDTESLLGKLDRRYRKFVVPQTYYPDSFEKTVRVRRALFSVDRDLNRLKRLLLVEDPFDTRLFLTQLHAEVLNRPYQPMKVGFLASEVADKLSRFLEFVYRRAARSRISKKDLMATIKGLEALKVRGLVPEKTDLEPLCVAADQLRQMTDSAYSRLTLVEHVEEAFVDIKDQCVLMEDEVVLAGHPFQRVDQILAEDSRVNVRAENSHKRLQRAQFKTGEAHELDGLFLRRGVISMEVNVPDPDKPLVLLSHQYRRRGGCKLHFEWNGKPIQAIETDESGESNRWETRGLVIAPEQLAANQNILKIRIERSDLDFGFFDLNAYQPVTLQGGSDDQ